MKIVIDTHVLLWYLIPNKRLKPEISRILDQAEKIFVPTIVILELFYTLKKLKIVNQFEEMLMIIKTSKQYEITTMDIKVTELVIDSGGVIPASPKPRSLRAGM